MPSITINQLPSYSYDKSTGRYRNLANGRFVTGAEIRSAIDKVIAGSESDLFAHAEQLQTGKITLAEWQFQTARTLKDLHVATGMAAAGGFANMTQADYGYLGSMLKQQYHYLQGFAFSISSGKQKLDGSFMQRVKLYSQAARGTFEQMKKQEARKAGFTLERRILAIADHCYQCVAAADRGWQPIGTLPAIGVTICKTNCKCSFEYF